MSASESYSFSIKTDLSYENAIQEVTAALKVEGFGVLTEIDVQATLKKKLNVETDRYVILGACNPPLAHKAIQIDPEIGLLLPCNVIVYEVEGGSVVSIIDPLSMFGVVRSPELETVAGEARARLKRVIDSFQR